MESPISAASTRTGRRYAGIKGAGAVSGIDTEKKVAHGGIAHCGGFVDLLFFDTGLGGQTAYNFIKRLHHLTLHPCQTLRAFRRIGYPRDHIGAVYILGIGGGPEGKRFPAVQIVQRAHDRGGADIKSDPVKAAPRAARLYGDEPLLSEHCGDCKFFMAQYLRQLRKQASRESNPVLPGQPAEQPFQVGSLILHSGGNKGELNLVYGGLNGDLPVILRK